MMLTGALRKMYNMVDSRECEKEKSGILGGFEDIQGDNNRWIWSKSRIKFLSSFFLWSSSARLVQAGKEKTGRPGGRKEVILSG